MTDKSSKIHVPPKGTRGTRMFEVMGKLMRPLSGLEVSRHMKAKGPEASTFMGFPVLVLTTIGAHTGQERRSVLGGFPDGENAWLIVASKGGSATNPAWFHNIAVHPDRVWVQIGNRKFRVHCESLMGKAREDAYARVAAAAPQYAGYPKKTDREIPVLRLTPAE